MSALAIFSEGSCVWVINVFFFPLKGGNACRIRREDSGQAGKDHR